MTTKTVETPDVEVRSPLDFRSLIENVPDSIAVLDPKGIIRYESSSIERMLGFTPAELVGQNALRLIHPDDAESVRKAFAESIQHPRVPQRVEFRHLHRDGCWRFLEAVGQSIHESGEVSVIVNSRDVTDRKQLEQNLLHKQKMETFGQLAGGVAHDFNNALTIITGYSDIVLDMLGPNHPAREAITEMQKAGERASILTRQLLAFSRKHVPVPVILNVNAIVAEMKKMLIRLIGENIELTSDLQPNLPKVKADPRQIEQVIMNLVVNARDAMPGGGRLSISTSQKSVYETVHDTIPEIAPGSYVVLTVRDTGCGMDAETLAQVFEPFFTTKATGKGTGLGLTTVFGIVVHSGGHILVSSKPGTGSTFEIYLPQINSRGPKSASEPGISELPQGSETVLVAEDDDNVRKVISQFLRVNGYRVLEAVDGCDALNVAGEFDGVIDLLLTDVMMPRLGGGDLARELTTRLPGVKVLFLSGHVDDVAVQQGLNSGNVSLLQKPFSPSALALKVRETLDR